MIFTHKLTLLNLRNINSPLKTFQTQWRIHFCGYQGSKLCKIILRHFTLQLILSAILQENIPKLHQKIHAVSWVLNEKLFIFQQKKKPEEATFQKIICHKFCVTSKFKVQYLNIQKSSRMKNWRCIKWRVLLITKSDASLKI